MGDYNMKLTLGKLRGLVKQVIKENKMLLAESIVKMNYEETMNALRGLDETVETVAFMTANNPMAQQLPKKQNNMLNRRLEKELRKQGLDAVKVGAVFEGNKENSYMILNATQKQLDSFNRQFQQWGYVYGQNTPEGMVFELRKINYPEVDPMIDSDLAAVERSHFEAGDLGSMRDPDSVPTKQIHTDPSVSTGAGRPDNFSVIDGRKVVIPFYPQYGDPTPSQMTDPDLFHYERSKKSRKLENRKRRR